jgi:hypothetical protein
MTKGCRAHGKNAIFQDCGVTQTKADAKAMDWQTRKVKEIAMDIRTHTHILMSELRSTAKHVEALIRTLSSSMA